MKTLWCVLAVGLAGLGMSAEAQLPTSVREPYLRYVEALESGDRHAAADAAVRAWQAGREAYIDGPTLAALGTNAVAATDETEQWAVLGPLALDVGTLLAEQGDPETAMAVFVRGRAGAMTDRNRLVDGRLRREAVLLFANTQALDPDWLISLLGVAHGLGLERLNPVEVEAAFIEEMQNPDPDPERLVNLALMTLTNGPERDAAARLGVVTETVVLLQEHGLADQNRVDPLLAFAGYALADLEVTGSGVAGLDPRLASAWCGYLERQIVPLGDEFETRYPPRAMERGQRAAVTHQRLSVPAAGGRARILGTAQEFWRSQARPGYFSRASERQLLSFEFRPTCTGMGEDRIVDVYEAFATVSRQGRGGYDVQGAVVSRYVVIADEQAD